MKITITGNRERFEKMLNEFEAIFGVLPTQFITPKRYEFKEDPRV